MATEAVIKERVLQLLQEKPQWTPTFCENCGTYSSKKHQGVWCAHCPGKMKKYPDMTYADCIRKSLPSAGWTNTFSHVYETRYNLHWEIPAEQKEMRRASVLCEELSKEK